jgi:hypothetical protein
MGMLEMDGDVGMALVPGHGSPIGYVYVYVYVHVYGGWSTSGSIIYYLVGR